MFGDIKLEPNVFKLFFPHLVVIKFHFSISVEADVCAERLRSLLLQRAVGSVTV